ncbi:MAG TPA: DNA alkylation repair protein [Nitrospirota bacterium]|nr:DNA alkylation repair protein [Nitrospirota bacterium]
MGIQEIQHRLRMLADKDKARILRGFFKTGQGQYGEGDVFIGVTVPVLRKLAKEYSNTPVDDVVLLLKSPIHEERMLALLMLIRSYAAGSEAVKKKIFGRYIANTRYINSWDLVDLSAPNIVGTHLFGKSRKQLYAFAGSEDLWKRRIAILSTFTFIRQNDFNDTLRLSRLLLKDEHDLIHKAVGWMLREVGKRSRDREEEFLRRHYRRMPRTMLRYAIERFPESARKKYLNGKG